MKNSPYQNILFLYLLNPGFVLLFAIFAVSAFFSKLFYHAGFFVYAEESFTFLFVVSLWLAFYLGILIKRQFATPRASLLPHYRRRHIYFIGVWYLIFMSIAYLWEFGIYPVMKISTMGLWGIYFICLLSAMLITYLGYLSIGRILIYSYVFLLVFSNYSAEAIVALNNSSVGTYVMIVACLSFGLFIGNRLRRLKENHFEYDYLLAWPPRHLILGQMKASQCLANFFNPFTRLFPVRTRSVLIAKYPRENHLWLRAFHWDYTEQTDFKVIWIVMLLIMPLFLLVGKQFVFQSFSQVYSNFLLFSLTPALLTIGANYKRIAYWGYDLLKPVTRENYIREQGLVLAVNLILYWTLFAICFAILPNIVFYPELFAAKKFWAYLFLTLNFSFVVLSWLAWLSCMIDAAPVIGHGIVLSLLTLFFFYCGGRFSFAQIMFSIVVCLMVSAVLSEHAYRIWCDKEFLE